MSHPLKKKASNEAMHDFTIGGDLSSTSKVSKGFASRA